MSATAPQACLNVMLVDDHPAIRTGLEVLLQTQGMRVVGAAENAEQGLRLYDAERPDVVVVDFNLGQEYGTDLADSIVELDPGAKVLVYTGAPDSETRERVSRSGARGLAHKSGDVCDLTLAIRTLASSPG
jgi:two-component system, NarL family, invasion response regulator UvrY